MNANIQGLLEYFRHKQLTCLQSNDGRDIPSEDAKIYLRWCLEHGYKDLKDAPDWDEYLKIKNK